MRNKGMLYLAGFLSAALLWPPEASALFLINEFLADPPAGAAGDANGDGVRDASDDEFVELFNPGPAGADLSGWSLWDRVALRHTFPPGTALAPLERLVIFGGGRPAGIPGLVAVASTGALSLNNAGDTILLKDPGGRLAEEVVFSREADQDQSLIRFPEGSGPFLPHRSASSIDLRFSPGADLEGMVGVPEPEADSSGDPNPGADPIPSLPVPDPLGLVPEPPEEWVTPPGFEAGSLLESTFPPSVVPEPSSGVLLGLGLLLMRALKRR